MATSFSQSITEEVREELTKHERILITTHVNPDADAIGSALGLQHFLINAFSRVKQVHVVLPSACPLNLLWMPGANSMMVWGEPTTQSESRLRVINELPEVDCIVVLDLNALSRLQTLGTAITNTSARIVNIDHHTFPEDFAHVQWVDVDAAATCQLIAELVISQTTNESHPDASSVPAPSGNERPWLADCAQCLYTGIMSDTGSFRFPRTTPQLFRTVAWLVEKGANPVLAYESTFNVNSMRRTRLLGATLATMQLYHNGLLCVMIIRASDLKKFDCTVDDTEGFVHHTLSIIGVSVGILLIEQPGVVKCSFRSKGQWKIRDLAAAYGGGGHDYAAGARIYDQTIDAAAETIVDAVGDMIMARH